MIKIIVKINFEFCAIKYQKIKQIKFKISFEIFETFERFKKQSNFVNIIKQILNILIEIQFRELFKISSEFSQQIFRDIINKKNKKNI